MDWACAMEVALSGVGTALSVEGEKAVPVWWDSTRVDDIYIYFFYRQMVLGCAMKVVLSRTGAALPGQKAVPVWWKSMRVANMYNRQVLMQARVNIHGVYIHRVGQNHKYLYIFMPIYIYIYTRCIHGILAGKSIHGHI